jgi:hypothetical protein
MRLRLLIRLSETPSYGPRRPINQLTDGGPSATAELPDGISVDIKAATTTNRGTALPLRQDDADMLGWEDQVCAVA